jgi:hypothetical protein
MCQFITASPDDESHKMAIGSAKGADPTRHKTER